MVEKEDDVVLESNRDLKWAIEEVMSKIYGPRDLAAMGMYNFDAGKLKSVSSYKLGFDSEQNQLEPTYYWLLDFMAQLNWSSKKVVDNFMASPG